jgi:hypothetical protein
MNHYIAETDTPYGYWIAAPVAAVIASLTGVVLLAKVYGFAEMSVTVPALIVPSTVALVIVMLATRKGPWRRLSESISIGLFGGLLSTLAYDLTRLPFHLLGYKVFVTNSTYGMWIMDAAHHTRVTETVGWVYHFSNGLLFSVMYALLMKNRHWLWAIVYAFALESIAVFSNFGHVFAMAGNYGMIGIAYLAHISYAVPIGLMVMHWDDVADWMREKRVVVGMFYLIFAVCFLPGLFAPGLIARDASATSGAFELRDYQLIPYMQRIKIGGSVTVHNTALVKKTVQIVDTGRTVSLAPNSTTNLDFATGGIYQLYVENPDGTTSSFVIVDPVGTSNK